MWIDLPEFKRCCFCLPLRYGLLVWAYLKLAMSLFLLFYFTLLLYTTIKAAIQYPEWSVRGRLIPLSVITSLLVLELSLTAVFVAGAHQKNVKLLKVYFYYMIAILALFTLACVATFAIFMNGVIKNSVNHSILQLCNFSGIFLNFVLQLYVLLLIRSEIMKLRRNCNFKFVNYADQSQCTMAMDHEQNDEAVLNHLSNVVNEKIVKE